MKSSVGALAAALQRRKKKEKGKEKVVWKPDWSLKWVKLIILEHVPIVTLTEELLEGQLGRLGPLVLYCKCFKERLFLFLLLLHLRLNPSRPALL
jgi:ABC-type proline/glycine betaine transport system substrate-binding protein